MTKDQKTDLNNNSGVLEQTIARWLVTIEKTTKPVVKAN